MCFVGADAFKVKISPLNKQEHVRIHVPPPLDRKDGSFLARYRLYGTVLGGLKVEVLHQGVAVAKSPYTIHGLCCFIHNNNNEPRVIDSRLNLLDILKCTFGLIAWATRVGFRSTKFHRELHKRTAFTSLEL